MLGVKKKKASLVIIIFEQEVGDYLVRVAARRSPRAHFVRVEPKKSESHNK